MWQLSQESVLWAKMASAVWRLLNKQKEMSMEKTTVVMHGGSNKESLPLALFSVSPILNQNQPEQGR